MGQYALAGRKCWVSTGVKAATITNPTALVVGDWYIISAKGGATTLPAAILVDYPFRATTALVPAAGDILYPITWTQLCVAKDKSVAYAKGELDATSDCDDIADYISNELPEQSFTFTGNNAAAQDIIQVLENRFSIVATDDGAGTYTFDEVDNADFWLKIDYSQRDRASTDDVKAVVGPVIFTSFDKSAPQNGIQDFSANGRWQSTDEAGHHGLLYYGTEV